MEINRVRQEYYQRRKKRLTQRLANEQDEIEKYRLRRAIRICDKNYKDYLQYVSGGGIIKEDGGKGSGNFGHKGRPGAIGGSGEGGTSSSGSSSKVKSGGAAEKDHTFSSKVSSEAQKKYDSIRAKEPKITADISKVADSMGCKMEGLEYSVKTASSIEDKIARLKQSDPSMSDAECIAKMGDIVRYTELGKHKDLAKITNKTVEQLEKSGYSVVSLDNKYLKKDATYKGIHLGVVSPDGQKFELQIHSEESMAVKNKTHKLYEIARNVNTDKETVERINAEMKQIARDLPDPDNIESLQNRG